MFLNSKFFLYFFIFSGFVYGQDTSNKNGISEGKTIDVLRSVETYFNVYYSFADDLIKDKHLYFKYEINSVELFHSILEMQNNIEVIKVGSNLYSLVESKGMTSTTELSEVVIKGYMINTMTRNTKVTVLKSFNTELLPGVCDFDVLRSFQQLPGVKSPNQTANSLYVKGGGPDQNLLLWNQIKIYHPGHLFGMISAVNPQMVDIASFYTNVMPSNYGERISSVIDLQSSDFDSEKDKLNTLKIGANMLYTDLSQRFILKNKKTRFRYSLRKSLSPLIITPAYESFTEKVFQNTPFSLNENNNNFDFWDGSFVFDKKLSENSSIVFSSTIIKNDLKYSNFLDRVDSQNQRMDIENYGSSLQFKSKLGEKFKYGSTIRFTHYDFNLTKVVNRPSDNEFFKKKNILDDYGLDLFFDYNSTKGVKHFFGYQFSVSKVKHLIRNDNENFGFTISEKKGELILNSAYYIAQMKQGNYEFNLSSRLTLNNSSALFFEPRLNFTYSYNNHLQSILSYERRSQHLQQINENAAGDISLENYIWVQSDKETIPVLLSDQFNFGLLYRKNKFIFDLNLYLKSTKGVTSFSEGVVFSETGNSAGLASLSSGNNLSSGVDVSFQREISNFKFWTSYSFLNSENKIVGINDGRYFRSNGSISHTINITTSYKFSKIYATLGWFWNSGRPFSELDISNSVININNLTLPDFHSLDLSFLYSIVSNSSFHLKAGITINNLYDNRVIINKEIVRIYESAEDLNNPRYSSTNYYSLGFTPNLFLKLSF